MVEMNLSSLLKESHGPCFQRHHFRDPRILILIKKLDGEQLCLVLLQYHVQGTSLEARYLVGLNAILFATMLTLNSSQMKY
jgi:hypothetical protein